jgi:hypothetical protein
MSAPDAGHHRKMPGPPELVHYVAHTTTNGVRVPLCMHATAARENGDYDPASWGLFGEHPTDARPCMVTRMIFGDRDRVTCDRCREWIHA